MTHYPLLEEFLALEGIATVRSVLLPEMAQRSQGMCEFSFNVFNVQLDVDAGMAIVDDELDVSRTERVPLAHLRSRLDVAT